MLRFTQDSKEAVVVLEVENRVFVVSSDLD